MKPERLLAHFDQIADTPDAVPRLRRFILDLAVRGKLVEQDPNDEPAAELVKRVATEKNRLIRVGEIKKSKLLPAIAASETPFKLPQNWTWVRLDNIAIYIQRGKSPSYSSSAGPIVVSQRCVQWCGLDLSVAKNISKDSLEKYEPIRFIQHGDLLWNSTGTGTIGRVIKVVNPPEKLVCDSHVTVVRCLYADPEYVRSWLRSDQVYGSIEKRAAGSTNQVELTGQMATHQVVPLPPLAEQHRIVAKVDELMALCDRLEAAQAKRESRRDRLETAALQRLTATANGDGIDEFRENARFLLSHLPRITTRPEHIPALRLTILDLAVRGKLVEQDPGDEPAVVLVEKINNKKAQLMAKGIIKSKQKPQEIDEADLPFSIHKSWAWVRLASIADVQDPNPSHRMPQYVNEGGVPFISSENFTGVDDINFLIGKKVQIQTLNEQIDRFSILDGAIAFTRIGTIGKTRFLPMERNYCLSHAVSVINPLDHNCLSMHLLRFYLGAVTILAFAHRGARSVGVPDLGMAVIRNMLIPLPPLAEQHRIVAKVDELMALCDRLEAQLSSAQATRRRLLEAVLQEALGAAPTPPAPRLAQAGPPPQALEGASLADDHTPPQSLADAGPHARPDRPAPPPPARRRKDPGATPEAILAHMSPGQGYSRAQLADALGLTVSEWNTAIRELKESGRVVQTGERRGARYRVTFVHV